jgi:hypothetical protein
VSICVLRGSTVNSEVKIWELGTPPSCPGCTLHRPSSPSHVTEQPNFGSLSGRYCDHTYSLVRAGRSAFCLATRCIGQMPDTMPDTGATESHHRCDIESYISLPILHIQGSHARRGHPQQRAMHRAISWMVHILRATPGTYGTIACSLRLHYQCWDREQAPCSGALRVGSPGARLMV